MLTNMYKSAKNAKIPEGTSRKVKRWFGGDQGGLEIWPCGILTKIPHSFEVCTRTDHGIILITLGIEVYKYIENNLSKIIYVLGLV